MENNETNVWDAQANIFELGIYSYHYKWSPAEFCTKPLPFPIPAYWEVPRRVKQKALFQYIRPVQRHVNLLYAGGTIGAWFIWQLLLTVHYLLLNGSCWQQNSIFLFTSNIKATTQAPPQLWVGELSLKHPYVLHSQL